ncbi:hypothetical protein GY45DRAFT_757641 [Cubamyces sp. BRFM 1775]|nr:hypothetical protein GY45DRAFT_757641 [Cubamyces sp. BRFM 1775]
MGRGRVWHPGCSACGSFVWHAKLPWVAGVYMNRYPRVGSATIARSSSTPATTLVVFLSCILPLSPVSPVCLRLALLLVILQLVT